jgi:site-specific DNA-methyltransferase (adenine-specific)
MGARRAVVPEDGSITDRAVSVASMHPSDSAAVVSGERRWALIQGDCLDPETGLASLPDIGADHVITDPPYSEALYSRTRTNRGRHDLRTPNDVHAARELADRRIGAIDAILDEVAAHALRVTRRWVVVFHDVEIGDRWRAQMREAYVRTGAWVKTDPMPQVSGDRPGQGFEQCTIAHRRGHGRMRWNGGGRAAVWTFGREQAASRPDHPCPKPLALMESLIRDFTDPGELVIDPFAGSATTGVACLRLGRRFIGWERDPAFHAAAVRRLESTAEQRELLSAERFRRAAKQKREQVALF